MNFNDFGFIPQIVKAVEECGYEIATPIQEKAIPHVLSGKDVMGLAQTGTGKTAAFALPLLQRLSKGPKGRVRVLILAPTRELAEQTQQAFTVLGKYINFKSVSVYGGVGIVPQMQKLRKGVELVVACPGRLLDHIARGTIDLRNVEALVLDEADRMFDMGFLPDIKKILTRLPVQRQTLLFSATMPGDIRKLAQEILVDPAVVQVHHEAPAETISHALYPVEQ
ncbi:MAG: DEAD/DEAH box helicase, partial [Nitrospirota bacterium]